MSGLAGRLGREGEPDAPPVSDGMYENVNSGWIREVIAERHRVRPLGPPDPETLARRETALAEHEARLRHFVVCFQESTSECLAYDIEIDIAQESYATLHDRMLDRLFRMAT